MLKELHKILRENESQEKKGYEQVDLERAAAMLRRYQFIWKDGHGQKKAYDILVRYREYYSDLFAAFGDQFFVDDIYGYCGFIPKARIPHSSLRKLETILLLILAKLHDEESRKACTEKGRSFPSEVLLMDEYMRLTNQTKPGKVELNAALKTLKDMGVIELGTVNPYSEMPRITVLPSIMRVVTDEYMVELLNFTEERMGSEEADAETVLEGEEDEHDA